MAVSINETESKYDVPAGHVLPRLDDLPGVAGLSDSGKEQLEAEYYDTPDLRLIRAGITLRRRRGGEDAGWHLKLPAGTGSRQEIRVPLGRTGARVPRELSALVRAHTRGGALRPVARVTTRRHRVDLLDRSGESLAEVADDEVSAQTLGDSTTISHWHEVEVELTGGDRRLLREAGRRLHEAGLSPAGYAAKLERALGQPVGRPDTRPRLSPSSPAGEVVLAYLRSQAETLKLLDAQVRADEPDSVHQMRVTTRRLRSTLRTFRPVLRRSATDRVAGELQWLGGVLGKARDAEVLAEHLTEAIHQTPVEQNVGPVAARVQAHFAPVAAAARTEVLAALDSPRYFSLLDSLDQMVADPPLTARAHLPAASVLPAAVRRPYRQMGRRLHRAWQAPPGQRRDHALHQARKSAKRARYAGEAVSPVFGKQAARFTKRVKKLQSALGQHQDTVIARQVERELGMSAHLAGENAYTYGLLYAREILAAQQFQDKARRQWRRARCGRYRRWLR
jgi:CHAD domain-containing protein